MDALYRRTMAELDRVFEDMPDVARRTGSLRIATSTDEEQDCERQLASMRASGLPVEPYEGREGRGLLIPTDGVFDPLMRCRVLARRVLGGGARLYARTPALEVLPCKVRTPNATVTCDQVVVAVDGGLELLLPELEDEVRTARLQMLATAPVGQSRGSRAVYLRYGYEYWQQLPDGRIALGGFRDRGGEAEWTHDSKPGGVVQVELERYPEIRAALEERRMVLVEDVASSTIYSSVRERWESEGTEVPVRSVIALPFELDPSLTGVLFLRRGHERPALTREDAAFAESVMQAAIAAIQRAHLLEETRADNARLEALAQTDPLTQLLNRRALVERLAAELDRAQRYGSDGGPGPLQGRQRYLRAPLRRRGDSHGGASARR